MSGVTRGKFGPEAKKVVEKSKLLNDWRNAGRVWLGGQESGGKVQVELSKVDIENKLMS